MGALLFISGVCVGVFLMAGISLLFMSRGLRREAQELQEKKH